MKYNPNSLFPIPHSPRWRGRKGKIKGRERGEDVASTFLSFRREKGKIIGIQEEGERE